MRWPLDSKIRSGDAQFYREDHRPAVVKKKENSRMISVARRMRATPGFRIDWVSSYRYDNPGSLKRRNPNGPARDLLLNLVASEHTLLLSNEMLHELARVLRYPRLLAFYGLSEARVYHFIGFLREVAEIVTLSPLLTPDYSRCKRYRRPADSHTWRSEYPLHTR
jgi:hypothetical protein